MLMLEQLPGPPTMPVLSVIVNGGSFQILRASCSLIFSAWGQQGKEFDINLKHQEGGTGSIGNALLHSLSLSWGQPRPLCISQLCLCPLGPKETEAREEEDGFELLTPNTQHILSLNIVFQSLCLSLNTIWRRISQQTCPHFLLDIKC